MHRSPPGHNMPDVSVPGVQGVSSVPHEMGGMTVQDATVGQHLSLAALTAALASATPDQQRMVGDTFSFCLAP